MLQYNILDHFKASPNVLLEGYHDNAKSFMTSPYFIKGLNLVTKMNNHFSPMFLHNFSLHLSFRYDYVDRIIYSIVSYFRNFFCTGNISFKNNKRFKTFQNILYKKQIRGHSWTKTGLKNEMEVIYVDFISHEDFVVHYDNFKSIVFYFNGGFFLYTPRNLFFKIQPLATCIDRIFIPNPITLERNHGIVYNDNSPNFYKMPEGTLFIDKELYQEFSNTVVKDYISEFIRFLSSETMNFNLVYSSESIENVFFRRSDLSYYNETEIIRELKKRCKNYRDQIPPSEEYPSSEEYPF
jgi:hypothetical protein